MKRILLGTSALVAVAAVTAMTTAPAVAGEPLQLQLRGFHVGALSYTDVTVSSSLDENPVNFGSDSEIHFQATTILDNGLEIGFYAELELEDDPAVSGDNADVIDEVYIKVTGGFGQFQFGQQDGAMYQQHIGAPNVFVGHGVSQPNGSVDLDPFRAYRFGSGSQTSSFGGNPINTTAQFTDDNIKLIYFTPSMNGLQFGVSYTPNNCKNGPSGGGYSACVFDEFGRNFWEASFAWEVAMNNVMLGFSGGYGQGEGGTISNDPTEWQVGADASFGGFTLGGSYSVKETGGIDTEQNHWDVGATYETGPWGFGVQYGNADGDIDYGGAEDEQFTSWLGGITYMYGPGMQIGLGVQTLDVDDSGTFRDEDATSVFIENSMTF